MAREILFVAGLLPDHEYAGIPPPFTEDSLGGLEIQVTAATMLDFTAQFCKSSAGWDEFRRAWEFDHPRGGCNPFAIDSGPRDILD